MEVVYQHPWWTTLGVIIAFGFLSEIGRKK
ncbi:hypothetical protein SAMN05444673_2561 [Bacillus sp. OV166]|nr:hypothetical protein SAMN05444673_2561 [Bacillus sp. OV166]